MAEAKSPARISLRPVAKMLRNEVIMLYVLIFIGIAVPLVLTVIRTVKKVLSNYVDDTQKECGRGPGSGDETLPTEMGGQRVFYIRRVEDSENSGCFNILNQNREVMFGVEKKGFKQIIFDKDKNEIGQIKKKSVDLTLVLYVKIKDKYSFAVKKKETIDGLFKVQGLDYMIAGDFTGYENTLYDLHDRKQAIISVDKDGETVDKENDTYRGYDFGNTKITITREAKNNIYLVFVALCITMVNFGD